jgi:hypothetical protein
MTKKSSPFRFVSSSKRGEYSVWRGDEMIGYVSRNVYRLHGKTYPSGWMPATPGRLELVYARALQTRQDAARVLWDRYQAGKR